MYPSPTWQRVEEGPLIERERAVCLLQEATRFLQHYSSNPSCLNQQRNQQGTEDCVQFVPSNSNHNVPHTTLTRRDRDGVSGQSRSVLENFQALFAPYSQRPRPSAISSVQILQPPAKTMYVCIYVEHPFSIDSPNMMDFSPEVTRV